MSTMSGFGGETVAVVLAGGKGTRLGPLTRRVCKPALPFGAAYRSIDFSLSNCVNSGIDRIGVPTQYKPEPLLRHLKSVWQPALAAPGAFVSAWAAEDRAPRVGYRGTADAVYRNLDLIERLDSRQVLILAGDHVYRMDYRPMLTLHRERGAALTVGCVEVPAEDAHHFGILSIDGRGRIERFVEKPRTLEERPSAGGRVLASMGIYVFDTDLLTRALRLDAFSAESRHDFGRDILPRVLRETEVLAYPFRAAGGEPGYWRDIGTVEAYWRAHMELLEPEPSLRLDDAEWPMPASRDALARGALRRAKPLRTSTPTSSLVAGDCVIGGAAHRSVLFPGVEIGRGSEVTESVVLPGAVIGKGCRVRRAIVDAGCRLPDGTVIEGPEVSRSAAGPVVVTADPEAEQPICALA